MPDWQLPWPPEEHDASEPRTVRQLITRIGFQEVEAFKQRQNVSQIVRILTERQIEEGLVTKAGLIRVGEILHQIVNPEEAVGTALQAFEDGLFLVILDGEEQRELDRQIFLQAESHVVFVRMVMLAGG